MNKTDFASLKKWSKIPKDNQKRILENVFCSNCHVATIVDYTMREVEHGFVIEGRCKKCGKNVARLIENE